MGSNSMCVIMVKMSAIESQNVAVSIATRLGIGFRFPEGTRDFSFLHNVQPASYIAGPGVVSLRVTRPGREADHLTPPSANVKNDVTIPPLPHKSSWHSA
jgi:hypothetical protein